jgi:hypothetical protein
MQHSGVSTATCTPCHGSTASFTGVTSTKMGTSPAHIPTTAECNACHAGTSTFANGLAGSLTTLHNNVTNLTTCANCHGYTAKTFQGVNPVWSDGTGKLHMPIIAGTDCYTCHTAYAAVGGFATWTMATTEHGKLSNLATCTACHSGTWTYAGATVPKSKASTTGFTHIPTTLTGFVGDMCTNCHSATAFTTFSTPIKMNHGTFGPAGVTGNGAALNAPTSCNQCHGKGGLYAGAQRSTVVTINGHNGGKLQTDCNTSGCHKPSGKTGTPYTKWK